MMPETAAPGSPSGPEHESAMAVSTVRLAPLPSRAVLKIAGVRSSRFGVGSPAVLAQRAIRLQEPL